MPLAPVLGVKITTYNQLLLWTIFNPLGMSPTGLETMNVGM
jgi:hypothetical protein